MKKFENFQKALHNLHDINHYNEPYENVVLTGMVSLFEICFEQCWKAMKEILSMHGYEEGNTGSPRMTIKTAYKAGMIQDEQLWLEALDSRNNASHAYNQNIALGIVHKTKSEYIKMFEALEATLRTNWIE